MGFHRPVGWRDRYRRVGMEAPSQTAWSLHIPKFRWTSTVRRARLRQGLAGQVEPGRNPYAKMCKYEGSQLDAFISYLVSSKQFDQNDYHADLDFF